MCSSVSIVIPYFNRKKFEKLIEYNILCQNYPNIKEVIIADDSTEPNQRLELNIPYPIVYCSIPRCSIGFKRNYLNKKASGDIIANMDTDDIYFPDFIQSCVDTMIINDCEITGSSDMLFLNPITNYTGFQSCLYQNLLNEATMVYTKKYAETRFYQDRSHSENETFTKDFWMITQTPIENIMICVIHNNTVDKSSWENDNFKRALPAKFWRGKWFRILSKIFEKEIKQSKK
jgi:glycosyltransferase involved in cell wall biosynthesis